MSPELWVGALLVLLFAAAVLIIPSCHFIGPNQVGLLNKRFGRALEGSSPIAFHGEAGYQAQVLMPGFNFVFWPLFGFEKHPMVQVPTGQIGVVISQIGEPLAVNQRTAIHKPEFGQYTDLETFIKGGGQKGIQRPVLPPGTTLPLHPVAFLVLTPDRVYGKPVLDEYVRLASGGKLTPAHFGLEPNQLHQVVLEPEGADDYCGIVTTLEGPAIPDGGIAGRLGGFRDIERLEKGLPSVPTDGEQAVEDNPVDENALIELLLENKNAIHDNFQDYQKFLDEGGTVGLQHDPILYGAYNLNPFLVRVEKVPMLVVEQGQVAVIKAYVGLATEDQSGMEFKYGSIVRPGHRGIWNEPLRTGKYAINPRCYDAQIVPTSIVTLNWADAQSHAHDLDSELSPIDAKSQEGFEFRIDLQVQIHVPDTKAAKVISMVGTVQALVQEVLQAAVGNHFRDKLQSMPAVEFIHNRQTIQEEALAHIRSNLELYHVETPGVYIQDVVFPPELVQVLTQREIASQEVETFKQKKLAEDARLLTEAARGRADQQADLARSEVGIAIERNNAEARIAQAEGEAAYVEKTGQAAGAEVLSIGTAKATAYAQQVKAMGRDNTAMVNIAEALARGGIQVVPQVQVSGGGNASDALMATLTKALLSGNPLENLLRSRGAEAAGGKEQPEVESEPAAEDKKNPLPEQPDEPADH